MGRTTRRSERFTIADVDAIRATRGNSTPLLLEAVAAGANSRRSLDRPNRSERCHELLDGFHHSLGVRAGIAPILLRDHLQDRF